MSKVDLVIPTHNRAKYLKRILDYYSYINPKFNFIVADSSNKLNKKKNKKLIEQYPKLNILYLDKFPEKLEQHYKFARMVKYLKSKYCVFCPDDDFIVPNAIDQCVNFLEKNPDYSAAHGSYISFFVKRSLLGSKSFKWRLLFTSKSITSDKPIERLSKHLENFILVLWAVRRTRVVQACYEEFEKTKIDPYLLPVLGELLPDTLTVIFGKVKSINTFYGAREYLSQIRGYYPSLIDAKKVGKYDLNYRKFKQCLLNNLTTNPKTREEFSRNIDKAINLYTNYSYQEHIVSNLYKFLDVKFSLISKALKSLHSIYLFSKGGVGITSNLSKPSSRFFKDFESIRKIVIS